MLPLQGARLITGWGTKILQATQRNHKNKKINENLLKGNN